ncbi:IS110 family transposase [Mucilaginibacter sp. BT774]|uniref:IS110 family transposase n=1 Tax=Mucilaginibacter sp. BT774 TaxID=3062276 RepID=UPI00349FE674
MVSVPGVGPTTAAQIILCTNEFLNIDDPKKFPSYSGVAPFLRESGMKYRKARFSKHANKRMKALLRLGTLLLSFIIPKIAVTALHTLHTYRLA